MERRKARRQPHVPDELHVVIQRVDRPPRAVLDDDPGASPERHRQIAVEPAARLAHYQRGIVPLGESVAEEVPERRRHGGIGLALPVHLQRDAAQVLPVAARHSDPQPPHHAGARGVEQHRAVARRNLDEVVIPAGRVGGRDVLKAAPAPAPPAAPAPGRSEQVVERARGRRRLAARRQSDHEADARRAGVAESHATPLQSRAKDATRPTRCKRPVTSSAVQSL